jgi:hypothetical protein
MGCIGKSFPLIMILIMAISSLIIVKPAFAQSIPKPSVPQFTLKFIPVIQITTDPYTGANTTTQNLSTIELSITNQKYTYSNGSTFSLYYNVRTKGHFANAWTELYPTIRLLPQTGNYDFTNFQNYQSDYIWGENSTYNRPLLPQSDSTYTTVSLLATDYPSNGQVDIEVEAMLGVNSTYYLPANNFINFFGTNLPAVAYVTSSDWSNTQTITIPEGSTSTSTSPNPSVTVLEFPSWTIPLLLTIMVALAGLLVYHKKRKHYSQ